MKKSKHSIWRKNKGNNKPWYGGVGGFLPFIDSSGNPEQNIQTQLNKTDNRSIPENGGTTGVNGNIFAIPFQIKQSDNQHIVVGGNGGGGGVFRRIKVILKTRQSPFARIPGIFYSDILHSYISQCLCYKNPVII